MKKLIFFMVFILVTAANSGQVPQGFNYQAIARGADGKEIPNATFQIQQEVLLVHTYGKNSKLLKQIV
jgi:hypothetical protein